MVVKGQGLRDRRVKCERGKLDFGESIPLEIRD